MSSPMFPVPKDARATGASDVKWFAGLAMQAIIAKQSTLPDTETQREEIALWAFRMGQAMEKTAKQIRIEESE